jgi:hypothetical protein
VFAIDIETCRSTGKLRVIASIEEPAVIERIPEHLRCHTESVDPAHASRAPPRGDLLNQRAGTGGFWLERGCAGISGAKGKIQAPEWRRMGRHRQDGRLDQSMRPVSARPNSFAADIMAAYTHHPLEDGIPAGQRIQ